MSIDWGKKITVDQKQVQAAADALERQRSELDVLERSNKVLLRCFVTLCDKLIANGTVSSTDFSQEERSLYAAVKAKKEELYP